MKVYRDPVEEFIRVAQQDHIRNTLNRGFGDVFETDECSQAKLHIFISFYVCYYFYTQNISIDVFLLN